jgi:hypothetical protein
MDPRFTSRLTESQYNRRRGDPERGYGIYRPPVDHLRPRLVATTRRHLAGFFLGLGNRLSDEPRASDAAVRPVTRSELTPELLVEFPEAGATRARRSDDWSLTADCPQLVSGDGSGA